jgi:hypothetical protein
VEAIIGAESGRTESDRAFLSICHECERYYTELDKSLQIRVEKWVEKLCMTGFNSVWKKHRNAYAKLLLHMILNKRFQEPFDKLPPQGQLPSFPVHLRTYNVRGAYAMYDHTHKKPFWRDMYQRVHKSGISLDITEEQRENQMTSFDDDVEDLRDSNNQILEIRRLDLVIRDQQRKLDAVAEQLEGERKQRETLAEEAAVVKKSKEEEEEEKASRGREKRSLTWLVERKMEDQQRRLAASVRKSKTNCSLLGCDDEEDDEGEGGERDDSLSMEADSLLHPAGEPAATKPIPVAIVRDYTSRNSKENDEQAGTGEKKQEPEPCNCHSVDVGTSTTKDDDDKAPLSRGRVSHAWKFLLDLSTAPSVAAAMNTLEAKESGGGDDVWPFHAANYYEDPSVFAPNPDTAGNIAAENEDLALYDQPLDTADFMLRLNHKMFTQAERKTKENPPPRAPALVPSTCHPRLSSRMSPGPGAASHPARPRLSGGSVSSSADTRTQSMRQQQQERSVAGGYDGAPSYDYGSRTSLGRGRGSHVVPDNVPTDASGNVYQYLERHLELDHWEYRSGVGTHFPPRAPE